MKFIVDEIPKSESECPFSEWKPYPPIMEETGRYICKINHNDCNLCETECKFLEQEAVVHCKDCKHRDPEDHKCDCGHDIQWQLPRADEWFCADGEKKDESN